MKVGAPSATLAGMKRRLLYPLLLLAALSAPALADEAEEGACVARPTEACVLALLSTSVEWADSPQSKASYFSELGQTYGMAGRREESGKYFAQALAFAETVEDPEVRHKTVYWIGEGMMRAGDWQGAAGAFRRVPDSMGNHIVQSFGAWRLADVGEFDLAFEAALRLPHPQKRPDFLRHLAERQAEAGDIAGAWRSFWAILPSHVTTLAEVEALFSGRPEGLPVDVYVPLAAIAAAEVRAGNLDRAEALERLPHYSDISFPGVAARIAGALADIGQAQAALERASSLESVSGKVAAYRMIFDALAEQGAWADARDVAARLHDPGEILGALLCLSELQAAAGELGLAIQTYDDAVRGVTFFHMRMAEEALLETRLALASSLTRAGRKAEAEAYYSEVLEVLPWRRVSNKVLPLRFLRDVMDLVSTVAIARFEAGDAEGAASLIAEAAALADPEQKPRNSDHEWLKRKVEADSREFAPALAFAQARVGLLPAAMRTGLSFEPPSSTRATILRYVLRAVLTARNN